MAREVGRLIETLNEEAHRDEAAGLIRELIDRIVLTPSPDGSRLVVNLEGDLAGILAIAERDAGELATERTPTHDLTTAKALAGLTYRLPERSLEGVVGIGGCGGRI